MKRWRSPWIKIGLLLLVGLLLVAPAMAIQPLTGNQDNSGNVLLEKGKTIDDDVFVAGNEIVIDGDINGDLIAFGNKVTVNGVINGDVISAAQKITINGQVRDDARMAAEEIQINGKVERNLTTACRQLVIDKGGLVGRHAMAAGETVKIDGNLKGNLQGAMAILNIQGSLGGSGVIEADRVIVGPAGTIQGGLQYTSSKEAEVAPGGKILGPVERKEPVVKVEKDQQQTAPNPLFEVLSVLRVYLSGLLLWFLWRTFFPGSLKAWTETLTGKPGISFLLGFALLFTVVLGAIIVSFTAVGLSLGVLSLIAYGVILYLSKLAVAQVLGDEIFRRAGWQQKWAFPVGLLAIVLLGLLPYVGWIIKVAICIIGLGSASIALYRTAKRVNPSV